MSAGPTTITPADGGVVYEPVFQRRSRNRNLQWLRGVAALFVVLYHASGHLAASFDDQRLAAIFNHGFGLMGVAIFFAISGALMADILRTTSPAEFLIHRILRIYPIFIIASLVLPVVLLGDPGIDMRALSLVPIGQNGNFRLGAVEWTLVFELFFYVALFLVGVLGGARRLEAVAIVAILLSVGGTLLRPGVQAGIFATILQIPFLAATAAFAGGMLIPRLVQRRAFQPALAALALAAAMAAANIESIGAGRLLAGLAAVIIVGIAVSWAHTVSDQNFGARAATKLGDWSYALYLCHMPVILFVYDYIPVPSLVAFAIAVCGSLALAAPLGMLDLRLYAWLRKRSDRSTPESVRRWAWIYVGVYFVVAVVFLFKD